MTATVFGLFHVAIKTADLEATRAFYLGTLGLLEVPRPDFGYPGGWLACPAPGGNAIVHVYAGGPALGADGRVSAGSGAIDHVSQSCSGYHVFRQRFADSGVAWSESLVPGTALWQLFVHDPSGVLLELTFEGAAESGPPPDISPGQGYIAGRSFR